MNLFVSLLPDLEIFIDPKGKKGVRRTGPIAYEFEYKRSGSPWRSIDGPEFGQISLQKVPNSFGEQALPLQEL